MCWSPSLKLYACLNLLMPRDKWLTGTRCFSGRRGRPPGHSDLRGVPEILRPRGHRQVYPAQGPRLQ